MPAGLAAVTSAELTRVVADGLRGVPRVAIGPPAQIGEHGAQAGHPAAQKNRSADGEIALGGQPVGLVAHVLTDAKGVVDYHTPGWGPGVDGVAT
jgi:hypothetical protein